MNEPARLTLVIVGHITSDIVPGGSVPGGTVTYAGTMARNLGARVRVVTSVGADLDVATILTGIEARVVPSPTSSVFENIYEGTHRRQYIRSVARRLGAEAVPCEWRSPDIVLLAPLTNEVDPGVEDVFDGALRAATPQGWLRRWGPDGLVRHDGWGSLVERLRRLDIVIMSEEDVDRNADTIHLLAEAIPLLVVTRGARGGTIFSGGTERDFVAFPASEVEPTGAGDAFAGAFLVEYARTRDVARATRLAACAASFVVEHAGASGIPTLEQVRARQAATHL